MRISSVMGRRAVARLKDLLFHRHVEPGRLGLAVGLGIFIGMTPFYGFQTLLAVAVAGALGLNIAAMALASQISNPLFAPFIIVASVWLGDWMGDPAAPADGSWWDASHPRFYASWLRGSLTLGLLLGAACGLATWGVAARARRRRRA